MLDSLPEGVRAALLACCSIKTFDSARFSGLLVQHGLVGDENAIRDDVYSAVVGAHCQQVQRRWDWRRWSRPGLN